MRCSICFNYPDVLKPVGADYVGVWGLKLPLGNAMGAEPTIQKPLKPKNCRSNDTALILLSYIYISVLFILIVSLWLSSEKMLLLYKLQSAFMVGNFINF